MHIQQRRNKNLFRIYTQTTHITEPDKCETKHNLITRNMYKQ